MYHDPLPPCNAKSELSWLSFAGVDLSSHVSNASVDRNMASSKHVTHKEIVSIQDNSFRILQYLLNPCVEIRRFLQEDCSRQRLSLTEVQAFSHLVIVLISYFIHLNKYNALHLLISKSFLPEWLQDARLCLMSSTF